MGEAAVEIFRLLSRGRLDEETHTDVNPLRHELRSDAEVALRAAHWVYKQAYDGGRMLYEWHEGIERSLHEEARQIETNWWTRQAEGDPSPPTMSVPVPTRAPRTETAFRIEAFLHRVYEATGAKIDKTDFWLRPVKPDGTPRYSSDKEFRGFQREDPNLSQGVARIFTAVLKMTPEKFIEGNEERRQWLKAKRKMKVRR